MDKDSKPVACPSCGGEIPVGAPTGWCPRCALASLLADSPADKGLEVLSLQDIPPPGANVSYIGDYELLEVIAHGGMGVVYKARQKSLNRIVALKLLLGGAHASADFRKRFRQEAELAAQLHHPNIVPIFEAGEHEGQPYFSMEYVPGQDLANLTRGKPLPPELAVQYLKTIAEAVHYAHLQGVLHRDLKPSNVLLGSDGRLRITDFGLAKRFADSSTLTLSGSTLGTPGYLPPEQVSTKRGTVGVHSDVYSLGAILYHLLTGRAPFQGEAAADVLMQVLSEPPVPPSETNPTVQKSLDDVCLKCLAKKTGDRYASAKDLADELASPQLGLDLNSPQRRSVRPSRSLKRLALVGLAVTAIAIPIWMFALKGNRALTNSLGMRFVPVPGTEVLFSVWNTRVKDFQVFAEATHRFWPKPTFAQGPTHPAVMVSWQDANAFCTWLTERERKSGRLGSNQNYRLPTDAEWSMAVGLGAEEGHNPMEKDQRILKAYPWGQAWPPPPRSGNFAGEEVRDEAWPTNWPPPIKGYRDGYARTSPVGQFSANPYGLFDMCGNVWQWCEDEFNVGQWHGRVLRGGAWNTSTEAGLLSSMRHSDGYMVHYDVLGFRCVLSTNVTASENLRTTSQPGPTAKSKPWTNSLGMVFVPVPETKVYFSIWETRVQDFEAFVRATGYVATERVWSPRKEGWKQWGDSWLSPGFKQESTHPVCAVSWDDAHAFCEWLTTREQQAGRLSKDQEYRLPTDAEWSAAIGKSKYPWGESWPPPAGAGNYGGIEVNDENFPADWPQAQLTSDNYPRTSPVNAFPPNQFGLYDLGGNLSEWCEDWYQASLNSPDVRRFSWYENDGGGRSYRVSRGGSWRNSGEMERRSSFRNRTPPSDRGTDQGFRCVLAKSKGGFVEGNTNAISHPRVWIEWSTSQGGNGHYYALTSREMTWLDAEEEAKKQGGHLVAIADASEQSFLERAFLQGDLKSQPLWIGLKETERQGTYVWSSGEMVTYRNWAAGEPNHRADEHFGCLNWHFSVGDDRKGLGEWSDAPLNGTSFGDRADGPYFGILERESPLGKAAHQVVESKWTNSLGMVFVSVPGLRAKISVFETRVRDFQLFTNEALYDATKDMHSVKSYAWEKLGHSWQAPGFSQTSFHPVCGVSWKDAVAFCEWLTDRERAAGIISSSHRYRLPFDTEWSKAAGLEHESGNSPSENDVRIEGVFPWGGSWPCPTNSANYAATLRIENYAHTSPVGCFAANHLGLFDLGGNVWEWCMDWANSKQTHKVLRGASWFEDDVRDLLSSRRGSNLPNIRADTYGFRCVLEEQSPSVSPPTLPK